MSRGVAPLLVLALLAGCMHHAAPKLPGTAAPSTASGYVGGLFTKDTVVRFGLRLQNHGSKKSYVIEVANNAVGLIALPPGTYHVESWLTWPTLGGAILTEKPIQDGTTLGRLFDVKAGHVALLGGWSADRALGFGSNTFTIVSVPVTEAEAIGAFRAAYPRFVHAPVQCVYCAP